MKIIYPLKIQIKCSYTGCDRRSDDRRQQPSSCAHSLGAACGGTCFCLPWGGSRRRRHPLLQGGIHAAWGWYQLQLWYIYQEFLCLRSVQFMYIYYLKSRFFSIQVSIVYENLLTRHNPNCIEPQICSCKRVVKVHEDTKSYLTYLLACSRPSDRYGSGDVRYIGQPAAFYSKFSIADGPDISLDNWLILVFRIPICPIFRNLVQELRDKIKIPLLEVPLNTVDFSEHNVGASVLVYITLVNV